jgi:hypothetical protein
MPKVSRESASRGGDFGPVVDRSGQIEGYSVNFTSFREDIDATSPHEGTPGRSLSGARTGGMSSAGRVTFRYADREEVFEAGDAFYTPPGHVPVKNEPGSEVVMFSPAEELHKTEAVMMRNMQAMRGG